MDTQFQKEVCDIAKAVTEVTGDSTEPTIHKFATELSGLIYQIVRSSEDDAHLKLLNVTSSLEDLRTKRQRGY